jgi:isopentenyl diphosphate isomerase/L-lactate dehydrogenase-like FMN-dependent dehydrogenase
LPRFLFDYADGGAMSETTMRRNRAELSAIELRQRVLCNVGEIDTSTTLFGRKLPLPVALGPVGISGMFRRRGEVQAARAAHARGLPFTLSTVGVCPLKASSSPTMAGASSTVRCRRRARFPPSPTPSAIASRFSPIPEFAAGSTWRAC